MYVRPTSRRKRYAEAKQFWQSMAMRELRGIVLDMGEHLNTIDDDMTVREVVAMFGLCPKVGALLLPIGGLLLERSRQ